MPLAISLLMGACASPDCHNWQPPSADHRSAIASTDAGSSAHRTGNTPNEWVKWKTDNIIKGNNKSFADRYLDLQQKQKSWPTTKWQSEVKISKKKYVVTNEKQWWWVTSKNNIMLWNNNIIIYQCWNWSNWAKLISPNVMWLQTLFNRLLRKVKSCPQWSEVLLAVQK